MMLTFDFFNRDACTVAKQLLGKVIHAYYQDQWLLAQIVETEAYYLADKASHASLGFTEKRRALFMPAGTIYMYYARGKDSFNISTQGDGNAVLIKAGIPFTKAPNYESMCLIMQKLNPQANTQPRLVHRLRAGQTLLCNSLNIRVRDWDQQQFCSERLFIADHGYSPQQITQRTRLGIPIGRDAHLPYRFIDSMYQHAATQR